MGIVRGLGAIFSFYFNFLFFCMRPATDKSSRGFVSVSIFFRCSVGSAYDLLFRHIFSLVTLILIILLKPSTPPPPPFSYMCSGQGDGIGPGFLQIGTENKKPAIFTPAKAKVKRCQNPPSSSDAYVCMYVCGRYRSPQTKTPSFLFLISSLIPPPLLPPPRRISPLPQHPLRLSSLPACTR